jgi:hypothetical protein
MAGRPNHPFWTLMTESLIAYSYNYLFPYITISYASGMWFETSIWQKYHSALPKVNTAIGHDERLVRIMMDDRPGTEPWIYFTQERGQSWVNWDAWLFQWVGDHLVLFGLGLVVQSIVIIWGIRRCFGRGKNIPGLKRRDERGWYARLTGHEELDTVRHEYV